MKCPLCERGKLVRVEEDIVFVYKKHEKKFPKEKLSRCPVCNYETLSKKDTKRVDREMTEFRKTIDNS
jgi:uncharacterized protein with PIN domain